MDLWTGRDAEFKAKSIQNKANRGKEGTHGQGNRDFFRFKDHVVYIWNNLLLFPVMFLFLCITFVFCAAGGHYWTAGHS